MNRESLLAQVGNLGVEAQRREVPGHGGRGRRKHQAQVENGVWKQKEQEQ